MRLSAERLARVERLDAGDVLPVALQQVGDPTQDPGPLGDRRGPPAARVVERGARGGDRGGDVVGTGLVDRLHHAPVERVEHVRGAAGACGPLAVDVEAGHEAIVPDWHATSRGPQAAGRRCRSSDRCQAWAAFSQALTLSGLASTHCWAAFSASTLSSVIAFATLFWSSLVQLNALTSL